jgi:hypothetical protein
MMPGRPQNVIRVPQPPRSAFNKDRPASRLLLDQMIHVANALAAHLKTLDNRLSTAPVTEAQAGHFVRLATSILHPHIAPPQAKKKIKTSVKNRKGRGRG